MEESRPRLTRRDLGGIFEELRAKFTPATVAHSEYFAVPVNNFGDCVLVRRISGEATCELPKREPVVVFNENLQDLVENTILIKRHFVLNPFLADRCEIQRPRSVQESAPWEPVATIYCSCRRGNNSVCDDEIVASRASWQRALNAAQTPGFAS